MEHTTGSSNESMWSMHIARIAIVNIVGGLFFGYGIGFAAVYLTFSQINGKCTDLLSEEACNGVQFAQCTWLNNRTIANVSNDGLSGCHHNDVLDGVLCPLLSQDACSNQPECAFDYDEGACGHVVGWSPTQIGVFAAAVMLGYAIGSSFAPFPLQKIGRKKTLLLLGGIGVVGTVLQMIAHATNSYATIVIGRVIAGSAGGALCVAAPLYVGEMVPEHLRGPLGVVYQIATTLSIAAVAGLGYALEPTDFSNHLAMDSRFHAVMAVQCLIGLAVVGVAIMIPESTAWAKESEHEVPLVEVLEAKDAVSQDDSWSSNRGRLVAALVLSVAQQMTGIIAIMSYAPVITGSIGLAPLLGNFVVMVWNFVTTFIAVPLAKRFSLRRMYLVTCLAGSMACIMVGIVVLPGVTSESSRNILAGLGILGFIAAFELGMGPTFFLLAQDLFPREFRSRGASFTNVTSGVLAVIVGLMFPIAVESFSGGKSGDQNLGMGTVFISFGVFGTLSWGVLVVKLFPAQEKAAPEDEYVALHQVPELNLL